MIVAPLKTQDFFVHLRGALARVGLAGEEKFGVAIFFTMISGFRANPLRVALEEMTDDVAATEYPGGYCVPVLAPLLPVYIGKSIGRDWPVYVSSML